MAIAQRCTVFAAITAAALLTTGRCWVHGRAFTGRRRANGIDLRSYGARHGRVSHRTRRRLFRMLDFSKRGWRLHGGVSW